MAPDQRRRRRRETSPPAAMAQSTPKASTVAATRGAWYGEVQSVVNLEWRIAEQAPPAR